MFIVGQELERPQLEVGKLTEALKIDGQLNEPDWAKAPVLNNFLTTEPVEKGTPSYETLVRVMADEKSIVIGVECKDPNPEDIVRFSKIRDADIDEEDHVKIVL